MARFKREIANAMIRRRTRAHSKEVKKSNVWDALNKPVSVAILTSVLVSGVARIYSDHLNYLAAKQATENELNDIRLEIVLRDEAIQGVVFKARPRPDPGPHPDQWFDVHDKFESCRKPKDEPFRPASNVPIDLTIPQPSRDSIAAIAMGTPPFQPALPKYRGVSLAALMFRSDQLRGVRFHKFRSGYVDDRTDKDVNLDSITRMNDLGGEWDACGVFQSLGKLDAYEDAGDVDD